MVMIGLEIAENSINDMSVKPMWSILEVIKVMWIAGADSMRTTCWHIVPGGVLSEE